MKSFAAAPKAKTLFSIFLSLVLITGLLPYNAADAYADETDGIELSDVNDTQASDAAEGESTSIDATIDDAIDAAATEAVEETVDTTDTAAGVDADEQSADANVSALTDSEDVKIVEDASAFNFIYVDTKTVALGGTEYVAIDFAQPENAATAKLWYQHDDGELESIDASNTADGAALYEWTFEDNAALGTYDLVKVSWGSEEDGTAGEAAINSDTELGYSFSVVEQIEEDTEESEEGISVYTIDEEGELQESDSLSDALQDAEESLGVEVDSTASASDDGILSTVTNLFAARQAYAATSVTIALDPGHGGKDSGAVNGSLLEKNLNLKIAKYCKAKLDKQSGITTFMTRSDDTFVELEDRVTKAVNAGAQIFVSFHINSAASATGFEVWVQNDSSWRYQLHTQSSELGSTILNKLTKLGLKNRGLKESDYGDGVAYSDGSAADGLSVLRNSRKSNMPAVLIEHGFINGAASDQNMLRSESGLKNMGEADADGIIEYCNKHKSELAKTESDFALVYDYNYYIAHNADVKAAFNGDKQKTFQHFITYGMNEGRQGNIIFDVNYYRDAYADLQNAYGSNLKAYYLHYIKYGNGEGRAASKADEFLIMGSTQTTAAEMASCYKKTVGASTYPSSTYSSKGAATIDEFAKIVYEEANAEGVRAEVVFCQAMKETGWLKFGGSVKAEQCNFAGLGATSSTASGASFADVRTGIRAQVQHLKAYASTESLKNKCVDPRFNLVKRGSATKLTGLNGKWAVPGITYGQEIYALMESLSPAAVSNGTTPMYRLYNPNSGEHFYTASTSERTSLIKVGWKNEGTGWTAPASSKTPVYRLYSGTDHHYTTSISERDYLIKVGWKYEGIGWYSDDSKGVAVYRQFNPNVNPKAKKNNSGSHNYTTSKVENDNLVKLGWRAEGIGWYGVK